MLITSGDKVAVDSGDDYSLTLADGDDPRGPGLMGGGLNPRGGPAFGRVKERRNPGREVSDSALRPHGVAQ